MAITNTAIATTPPKTSLDATSFDGSDEFTGDLNTNNDLPSQEVLKRIEDYTVLDRDGRTRPFKSLYSGPNMPRRVLIVFIRHFYCGNCQEYIRTLSSSITEDSLLHLHVPTFIAVVGCGNAGLIPMYQQTTNCPFPIYADPARKLYDELGMLRTLNPGSRPDYQRHGTAHGIFQSVAQGLKQLTKGKTFQGGDMHQVGGEFLFEPINMATPIASPAIGSGDDEQKQLSEQAIAQALLGAPPAQPGEEKRVTWCHRMRNTRDHAELPELREVLGFEDLGSGGKNKQRWTKAISVRKGTGLSSVSTTLSNPESLKGSGGREEDD